MRGSDEVDSRDGRQARSSGLTLLGLLGGAVLVAMLLGQLTAPDPQTRPPTAGASTTATDHPTGPAPYKPIGVESLKRCPVQVGGLTLDDELKPPGSALELWDCDALKGPWSVVIRAAGGHFGFHGAVVTFPIAQVGGGVPSTKPEGGLWNPGAQTLVFPIGSSHAQIVGDLGQTTLENLAARVTDLDGRPHFTALDGFAALATTTYGSPVIHEMRYGAMELGQKSTLGDELVFTGVTFAASLETLAFEFHAKPAGFVRGKPAVYSSALGGSGALAWEPAPGQVSYVGYSGGESSPEAVDALRALANKSRTLTPTQWETKDRLPVERSPGTTRKRP